MLPLGSATPDEVFRPVALSGGDPSGVLFSDGRRYLRGIRVERAGEVRALLSSGLVAALCARGMLPRTTLLESGVPEPMAGFELVLEHEGVGPLTYPREWSFCMVRSAALAYLDILEEAWRYGYALKDAHLFNFVFGGTTPVWVDVGSFVRTDADDRTLPWLAEFNAGVLAPLRIWADGGTFLARSAIRHPSEHFPHDEYFVYRYAAMRGSSALLRRLRRLLALRRDAAGIRGRSAQARLFRKIFALRPPAVFGKLRRAVEGLRAPRSSAWGDYQDEYAEASAVAAPTTRFARILQLLEEHRPTTMIELGGNAGVLSEAIARRLPEAHVTCTDYDPVAIDRLFERARRAGLKNLSAAVLDFMVPEFTLAESAPHQRLAADCVLALAVTHHLLLTQGYDYDTVLRRIREYTASLAFVEFMPLGLHDGRSAPPLPSWYNLDAFSDAFSRHFERVHMEQLDENRILLVGRTRSTGP